MHRGAQPLSMGKGKGGLNDALSPFPKLCSLSALAQTAPYEAVPCCVPSLCPEPSMEAATHAWTPPGRSKRHSRTW